MSRPPTPRAIDPPPILPNLLVHLLQSPHPTPTHLLICTSRADFIQQLQRSLETSSSTSTADDSENPDEAKAVMNNTLHTLSTSSLIKTTFITSLPALWAYLSVLPYRASASEDTSHVATSPHNPSRDVEASKMILLNPLSLHKETSHYSAQGLSRTLALAVGAGWGMGVGVGVVVCECADLGFGLLGLVVDGGGPAEASGTVGGEGVVAEEAGDDHAEEGDADDVVHSHREPGSTGDEGDPREGRVNVWDQRLPVLSPRTRTFNAIMSRDGAWAQKTVSVRDVMGRWCVFGRLPEVKRGIVSD